MLLEFSFKNFRSVKDEAVLSMLPVNSYKEHQENVHPCSIPGTGTDGVLTAAAIYGPNASGKLICCEQSTSLAISSWALRIRPICPDVKALSVTAIRRALAIRFTPTALATSTNSP